MKRRGDKTILRGSCLDTRLAHKQPKTKYSLTRLLLTRSSPHNNSNMCTSRPPPSSSLRLPITIPNTVESDNWKADPRTIGYRRLVKLIMWVLVIRQRYDPLYTISHSRISIQLVSPSWLVIMRSSRQICKVASLKWAASLNSNSIEMLLLLNTTWTSSRSEPDSR